PSSTRGRWPSCAGRRDRVRSSLPGSCRLVERDRAAPAVGPGTLFGRLRTGGETSAGTLQAPVPPAQGLPGLHVADPGEQLVAVLNGSAASLDEVLIRQPGRREWHGVRSREDLARCPTVHCDGREPWASDVRPGMVMAGVADDEHRYATLPQDD